MLKQIKRNSIRFLFFQWEETDDLIDKECIHRKNYIFRS